MSKYTNSAYSILMLASTMLLGKACMWLQPYFLALIHPLCICYMIPYLTEA
jgi:hypothetical protein